MIAHIMARALVDAQECFAQWVQIHQMVAQAVRGIQLQHDALRFLATPVEVAQAMQRVLDQRAEIAQALRGSAIYLPEPIAPDMGLAKVNFDIDLTADDEEDAADPDCEPLRQQIGFRLHSTEGGKKREGEPPAVD